MKTRITEIAKGFAGFACFLGCIIFWIPSAITDYRKYHRVMKDSDNPHVDIFRFISIYSIQMTLMLMNYDNPLPYDKRMPKFSPEEYIAFVWVFRYYILVNR